MYKIIFASILHLYSVVSQTPPSTHSDPPVPSVDLSNIPDDGTLGESLVTQLVISPYHYNRCCHSSCCTDGSTQ